MEPEIEAEEVAPLRERLPRRQMETTNNVTHVIESHTFSEEVEGTKLTYEYCEIKDGGGDFVKPKMGFGEEKMEVKLENHVIQTSSDTKQKDEGAETSKIIPASITAPSGDSVFGTLRNVTAQSGAVEIITVNEQQAAELYLERVFQNSEGHGFYCPNCRTCIQKVLILREVVQAPTPPAPPQPAPKQDIKCPSCFSFLIPLGRIFSCFGAGGKQPIADPTGHQVNAFSDTGAGSSQTIGGVSGNSKPSELPPSGALARSASNFVPGHVSQGNGLGGQEEDKGPGRIFYPFGDWDEQPIADPTDRIRPIPPARSSRVNGYPGKGQAQAVGATSAEDPPPCIVPIPYATGTTPSAPDPDGDHKKWDILKAIVYGGLLELIASLSVVTSAASSDSTTLNILTLALANIIGGLFILAHNLWELKADETGRGVNKYEELLGKKNYFPLHVFVAIFSFLIFGLVPPFVYSFSFSESDDKDLKLAAVAGASLLCITLLAIAKAYVQKACTYKEYVKTVLYYLGTSALTSVVSYFAGKLIKKVIEKLGWFDSSGNFSLALPEISMENLALSSF